MFTALHQYLNQLGVINFTGFILGTIGIILLPGPNSLFVLTLAVQNRQSHLLSLPLWQRIKLPVCAALGIMVGDFILVGVSTFGVASLLQKQHMLFSALKYAGAGYLSYLALGMLKQAYIEYKKIKTTNNDTAIDELVPTNSLKNAHTPYTSYQAFKTALTISLLNPKAIVFFIAFFIQFLKPSYQPLWLPVLVLIIVLQIISMSYLSSLIFLGSRLIIQLKKYPFSKVFGFLLVACLFLYFSLQLVLAKV